ncbi:Hypothetical predicted protein [Cloeon dipterum]|uniref:Alpha-mannosidase n=1 Tax=Cloeon dipterum TaxID=197152 RepID=A0A8S1E4J0_9INSE|nr:Hypothetical predicted protein [Cloeon dipterum]
MRMKLTFIIFLSALIVLGNSDPHCGYEACPKIDPKLFTVHLVPHTHDDVGWVRTVDDYYYGGNGVRGIFEGVVNELMINETRKFIWVETAYFWKWWSETKKDDLKENVKKLVANGQLELTGGAWSMNDEAVNHYQSTIDQFTWGFRRLSDVFGDCGRPHVGWQIDPFGHSRETASLMAQLGFDGLFFGRLDRDDKAHRTETKTMEMIWRGSKNLGEESDLFTGALSEGYTAPRGFCFDIYCPEHVSEDNYKEKVVKFVQIAKRQADMYRSNNVIWTMGADFAYTVAKRWYSNLDVLIRHVNEVSHKTGVAVAYSTPSCYLQALNAENRTWPVKEDDFFPYASEKHTYWTGYFTSRPNLKKFERDGNNLLQVCKQMHAITSSGESDDLNSLREAMCILQHHDAITGTEKQHVADDYAHILSRAISRCDTSTSQLLKLLTKKVDSQDTLIFSRCPTLNQSECSVSEESNTFVVTIYNPLAKKVNKFVRLPAPRDNGFTVTDLSTGKTLQVQFVPIPRSVEAIPVRLGKAKHELIFEAVDLPPLGFKSFHVSYQGRSRRRVLRDTNKQETDISNEILTISFDDESHLIESISVNGKKTKLTQELMFYKSGKASLGLRASGAYIFRPDPNTPFAIATDKVKINSYKGPHVEEVHQVFSDWASQIVRLYKGASHVEVEWLVGPIPTDDHVGKEVISRFTTKIDSKRNFVTDSNSREYLNRTRNFRETWQADILEPVAANYYPITSAISIEDEETKLAVLTDRAQGGGSIADGTLELMVHRRLVNDDNYGVSEVLNERQMGVGMFARGRHLVLVGSPTSNVTAQERTLVQQEMVLPPVLYFSPTTLSAEEWKAKYQTEFSGVKMELPENVHLLTLEPRKDGKILLRFEHIMEKSDDLRLSRASEFSIQDLFEAKVQKVTEMTLGANQILSSSRRFKWNEDKFTSGTKNDQDRTAPERNVIQSSDNFKVILYPMQIRTFVVEF